MILRELSVHRNNRLAVATNSACDAFKEISSL